jgi:hypothetical protein
MFCNFFTDQQIIFRVVDNFLMSGSSIGWHDLISLGIKVLFQVAVALMKVNTASLLKCKHSTDFLEVLSKSGKKFAASSRDCDSLFSVRIAAKVTC